MRGSKTQEILEDRGLDSQFSFKISFNCVLPENIHTLSPPSPPPWNGLEIPWGGRSKAQEFPEGEGIVLMNFLFFPTGFNFHTVVC